MSHQWQLMRLTRYDQRSVSYRGAHLHLNENPFVTYYVSMNGANANNNRDMVVEPPKKMCRTYEGPDLINELPKEMLIGIFRFLPTMKDRYLCTEVCRKWCLTIGHMRNSDFKHKFTPPESQISKIFSDEEISDCRAAAIATGMQSRGHVTDLSVMGLSQGYRPICDHNLGHITLNCNSLSTLNLVDCRNITSRGLISVAKNCNGLRKLEVKGISLLDDEGLSFVAENCPNLTYLIVKRCEKVTDQSLKAFGIHSEKLKHFGIKNCGKVTSTGLLDLITLRRTSLRSLKIVGIKLDDAVLNALSAPENEVHYLHLENVSSISPIGFSAIGLSQALNFLMLNNCDVFSNPSFELNPQCGYFNNLVDLELFSCPSFTDELLDETTRTAQNLQHLTIHSCNNFSFKGLIFSVTNLDLTLKTLRLIKCEFFGSEYLQSAFAYTRNSVLQKITVQECRGMGDNFMSWIGDYCKNLQQVSFISMDSITNHGVKNMLKNIEAVNKISRVNFTNCKNIGNPTVWAITKACKDNLVNLVFNECTKITDCGAVVIGKRCKFLKQLDLSGCNISDKTLLQMSNDDQLMDLELISLVGCVALTDNGMHALRNMGMSLEVINVTRCPLISKQMLLVLMDYFNQVLH